MTVPRQPEQFPPADAQASPPLSAKQQRQYLKWNFEKIKRDADELAALAESLQEELSKSNQNVLSVKVLEKAERIERLAKKIKNAAKGY